MSLMKELKGNSMKFHIFALLFLFSALLGTAKADDRVYFYLQCSQGQTCMDLADQDGKRESVLATPAQMLGRGDIESAIVQKGGDTQPSLALELSKEASRKFEKITEENIGKKLMVVLDNKILAAPTINAPIRDPKIKLTIFSRRNDLFWEKVPWLQDLVKQSYKSGGRPVMIYMIVTLGIAISAFAFVLVPRLKRTSHSTPE